ncbi:MAG: phage integrase N-terminal SAM-like domain-containing protein [Verrucomicrobiota bacterium]
MFLTVNLHFSLVKPGVFASLGRTIESGKHDNGKICSQCQIEAARTIARGHAFKHFSIRTEQAYWLWIRGFILFHQKRHPSHVLNKPGLGCGVCWI